MRRSRGCVWGFLRGCGMRTQLEELKGGQQGGSQQGNKGETHPPAQASKPKHRCCTPGLLGFPTSHRLTQLVRSMTLAPVTNRGRFCEVELGHISRLMWWSVVQFL